MPLSERVVERIALALLLVAAACGEHKERKRAELISPVRVAVRQHTSSMREPCRETGWRTPLCLVAKPRVRGCLYLELGKQIDEPLPSLPAPAAGAAPVDRCDQLAGDRDGRRVLEAGGGPEFVDAWSPSLVADPTGTRLAWRPAPELPWRIFYVVEAQVFEGRTLSSPSRPPRPTRHAPINSSNDEALGAQSEDGPPWGPPAPSSSPPPPVPIEPPPDWTKVPLFDEAVGEILDADPSRADAVVAAVEQRQGEPGLLRLARGRDPSSQAWLAATVRLGEEGLAAANADLIERLHADGGADSALLDYFVAHREAQPKDFAAVLAADVERQLVENPAPMYGETVAVAQISELARLGYPRAGVLACQSLGATFLGEQVEGSGLYAEGVGLDVSLLAAVVKQKTPCPWVSLALERMVCSGELWCTEDGKTQLELDDAASAEGAGSEESAPPPVPRRLCPASTGRRQAEASFQDDGTMPEQGPLLLAAATANGPLSKAFLARNARRVYEVRGLPPEENPDGGEADLPPCGLSADRVAALACALPLEVTEVAAGVCRIRLDDAKKTVTVEGPGAPPSLIGEGRYHRD